MLNTQEHIDLIEMFERTHQGGRRDKESKDLWKRGVIYQDAEVNKAFLAYRQGYAYGKAVQRSTQQETTDCLLEACKNALADFRMINESGNWPGHPFTQAVAELEAVIAKVTKE